MDFPDIAAVRNADLLRELGEPAWDALRRSGTSRQVTEGASLLKQGDKPSHLFLVVRGRFKMTSLTRDGSQKTLRFMRPGDVIGCAAVFRKIPYPATATATTDSVVEAWTAQQFGRILKLHPQLAANVLAVVSGRTDEMLQRLREVTTESADQRIARALLRFVEQAAFDVPPAAPIPLRISPAGLAELSDTSLFTASRTISAWTRVGIVAGGRERISIRDLGRLAQIAGK